MRPHPGQMAILDCLLTFGPRRPDWGRSGAPSPAELAQMLLYRQWVMGGHQSMPLAPLVAQAVVNAQKKAKLKVGRKKLEESGRVLQPRPPHMPADHPLVGRVYK